MVDRHVQVYLVGNKLLNVTATFLAGHFHNCNILQHASMFVSITLKSKLQRVFTDLKLKFPV